MKSRLVSVFLCFLIVISLALTLSACTPSVILDVVGKWKVDYSVFDADNEGYLIIEFFSEKYFETDMYVQKLYQYNKDNELINVPNSQPWHYDKETKAYYISDTLFVLSEDKKTLCCKNVPTSYGIKDITYTRVP